MQFFRYPILALAGLAALAACTPHDDTTEFNDPYEARNRAVHAFNKDLDRNLVRPLATGYATVTPPPVRRGIGNFASNLSLPGKVANSLLQLRIGDAVENTVRFGINSTLGLGGLFDPATSMGAPEIDTDFGETLHVWGVPEGAYVEVPFFGPSTERAAVGRVVDFLIDPLDSELDGDRARIARGSRVAARIGDRHDYSDVLDELLYDSADSYAQIRMTYLQKRRYDLRRGGQVEYTDPYDDLYEVPYDQ